MCLCWHAGAQLYHYKTDNILCIQADWKALRGAIVGCLALLRRKADVGIVTNFEAKSVAQSYLQNLQVQSLGQHDRKVNPWIIFVSITNHVWLFYYHVSNSLQLSFQLMECLLDRYSSAIEDLVNFITFPHLFLLFSFNICNA